MNAKELYKKLSRDKTSEKLWGLEEQPDITCPMIDATIGDVNSLISKLTEIVILIEENLPVLNDTKDEHLDFISNATDLINSIESLIREYKRLPVELESLRKYLTTIRQQAQDHKDKIWESISYSLDIEESIFKKTSRFPSVNSRRLKDQTGDEAQEIVKELIEAHKLSWDEFDSQDPEICRIQGLILESLTDLKESFLTDRPLDEVLNCHHLNEWVDSVLRISPGEAGEAFISFIESHGYSQS